MVSKLSVEQFDSSTKSGTSATQTDVHEIYGSLALITPLKADKRFGKYNVTHIPTGSFIRFFKKKSDARLAIREWNKLYNWDFTEIRCSSARLIGETIKQTPEWALGSR